MAEPLLDFLTGRAKAALPFLRGAVAQGLKPEQIIAALQASGIPTFRREVMLGIIAALENRADLARYLRIVPPTTPLPPEAHTVNVVYNQTDNYQYGVKIVDPASPAPTWVTVVSAIPLSASNIRAVAETMQTRYTQFIPNYDIESVDFQIIEANVKPTAP